MHHGEGHAQKAPNKTRHSRGKSCQSSKRPPLCKGVRERASDDHGFSSLGSVRLPSWRCTFPLLINLLKSFAAQHSISGLNSYILVRQELGSFPFPFLSTKVEGRLIGEHRGEIIGGSCENKSGLENVLNFHSPLQSSQG